VHAVIEQRRGHEVLEFLGLFREREV
jgi:hypothetical protein